MKKIFSSYVSTVHYDEGAKTLTVTYGKGGGTTYSGVPADIGRAVENAPSVGEALHREIRGRFPHVTQKAARS